MTVHVHRLEREPDRITCACGLTVPKPPGMPDYSRAAMSAWAGRAS